MTHTTTLQNGTYTFRSPLSNAHVVATFKAGLLTAWTYAGEAQTVTDLAAAQLAHQISYLDGIQFEAETVGNALAHELHKEMGRLKYGNHYATAAEVLGREVTSLAALTPEEFAVVRSYVFGQHGLPTGQWVAA